jgi:hypothetical protein
VVEERADGSRGFLAEVEEGKGAGEEVEGTVSVVLRFFFDAPASMLASCSSFLTGGSLEGSVGKGGVAVEVEDEGGPVQKST